MPNIHRYGDHASPEGIPRTPADSQLIAAFNFYAAAIRFADLADVMKKPEDAEWSRELAERIRKSVVKKYYDSQEKTFGNGTHDSLALAFGIMDSSETENVAASLSKVYRENGKRFDGGFMSYHIYPQLTKFGHVDLALDMLLNDDYPGIAQSIRDYDATTIFEKFRNDSRDQQLRHSLDHHAMNHPTAWLLNDVAGIRIHPDEPGSRRLLLAPHIPKNLNHVRSTLLTAYGLVKSEWTKKSGQVVWQMEIPPNSIADVCLPVAAKDLRVEGRATPKDYQSFNLVAGHHELQWQED
jgi:alpha-L-rhamnosidase